MQIRLGFLANHSSMCSIVYIPPSYTKQCFIDDVKKVANDIDLDESNCDTIDEAIEELIKGFDALASGGGISEDDIPGVNTSDGDSIFDDLMESFIVKTIETSGDSGDSYEAIGADEIDQIEKLQGSTTCNIKK